VISANLEDRTAIEEALRAQGVNEPERYFLVTPFTQGFASFVDTVGGWVIFGKPGKARHTQTLQTAARVVAIGGSR
jgi:hypothetical protein